MKKINKVISQIFTKKKPSYNLTKSLLILKKLAKLLNNLLVMIGYVLGGLRKNFNKILPTRVKKIPKHIQLSAIFLSILTILLIFFITSSIILAEPNKFKAIEKIKENKIHNFRLDENPPSRQIDSGGYLYKDTARNNFHDNDLNNFYEYPKYLKDFLLLSEDENFYGNKTSIGMVFNSIGRSIKSFGRAGGSGISQQTARTLINLESKTSFLDSARRKIEEIVVAQSIEEEFKKLYPTGNEYKDKTLLTYMNNVYLGTNVYGFQDAARVYFGYDSKTFKKMSVSHQATLVSMLSRPNAYICLKDVGVQKKEFKRIKIIRDLILEKAAKQNIIDRKILKLATSEEIKYRLNIKCKGNDESPYFAREVEAKLKELPVQKLNGRGVLTTNTTLQRKSQTSAEEILRKTINKFSNYGVKSGAIISMEINTAKIRVMASVSDQNYFNTTTQAYRQPGSIFKLFTYLTALEKGISPTTQFSCDELKWNNIKLAACHTPGDKDISSAIAYSENTIAWRVAQTVGMDNIISMAYRLGIPVTAKLKPDYGTVIGQNETSVTLLQMIRAYGAIANYGVMPEVQMIEYVSDTTTCSDYPINLKCKKIYEYEPKFKTVVSVQVANEMDKMLWGVVHKPGATGVLADIELKDEAGKTGTNGVKNDSRDLWYIGYSRSKNIITLVWLGNKSGDVIRSEDLNKDIGGHLAAKVWKDFMLSNVIVNENNNSIIKK
jgi:penicillin-binding protein 1A